MIQKINKPEVGKNNTKVTPNIDLVQSLIKLNVHFFFFPCLARENMNTLCRKIISYGDATVSKM